MNQGLIKGLPLADYLAGDEMSHSGLLLMASCPADYRYYRDHPEERGNALLTIVHG